MSPKDVMAEVHARRDAAFARLNSVLAGVIAVELLVMLWRL